MPTAVQSMKKELRRIQAAQDSCVTESGIVKASCRYKYQMLTREAAAFKRSIEWMESMREEGVR